MTEKRDCSGIDSSIHICERVIAQNIEEIALLEHESVNYENFRTDYYFAMMSCIIRNMRENDIPFKPIHLLWKQVMKDLIHNENVLGEPKGKGAVLK